MPRSAQVVLLEAGLGPVVDAAGVSLPLMSSALPASADEELECDDRGVDVVLQLIALRGSPEADAPPVPARVLCATQFFMFPPTITPPLSTIDLGGNTFAFRTAGDVVTVPPALHPSPYVPAAALPTGRVVLTATQHGAQTPGAITTDAPSSAALEDMQASAASVGLSLRFPVDAKYSLEFARYLSRHFLAVDVHDADSGLYLGCARIPLRLLLRQKRPASQVAGEFELIDTVSGLKRGRLLLRLANIARAVSGAIT